MSHTKWKSATQLLMTPSGATHLHSTYDTFWCDPSTYDPKYVISLLMLIFKTISLRYNFIFCVLRPSSMILSAHFFINEC